MKLDFSGLTLKQLREQQEQCITTISRLRNGLYNAEAALGLKSTLDLLHDFYSQIQEHYNKTLASIPEISEEITNVESN